MDMKVLIIEDDDRITLPLREDLERQHHFVDVASDGSTGLKQGLMSHYDVILLDVMLPIVDGLSVCRALRESGCTSAIIMLTAKRKTVERIEGLDAGADDYMPKPFDLDELNARIRAAFRRGTESRKPLLRLGDLSLDRNTCVTKYRAAVLSLTPTEYRLLEHFLSNPKRTYSRNDLMEKLWPDETLPSQYVIKTHIKGLRKKLMSAGAPADIIETVYGLGYRLKQDA